MNNYEILGLKKGVDKTEIKKTYKRLVLIYHPDKGGNHETFVKIQKAYDELMQGITGEPTYTNFNPGFNNYNNYQKGVDDYAKEFYDKYYKPNKNRYGRVGTYAVINDECKFKKDGSFKLCFSLTDIYKIYGRGKLSGSDWLVSNQPRKIDKATIIISKADLKKCNYYVKIEIADFWGNSTQKEFRIKKPKVSLFQKIKDFF